MCRLSVLSLFVSVLSTMSSVFGQRYIVPEATLEFLSPRGLNISIPDIDEGVTLVAFHININEDFYALEHGQWAQDIIKKRGGRWSYYIPDFRVKQGDTIYYWVYVIVDGLGYQGLDRSYKVTQANPHGPGSPYKPNPPREPVQPLNKPQQCGATATTRNGGRPACRDEVLLHKQFDNFDSWNSDIQIGGNQPEDEFTVFMNDPTVVSVKNGNLVIRPTLLERKYDSNFVRSGHLKLEGCTSSAPEHCERQAASYLILPPIMSARLTTRNSFSFRYGTVEIRAKLPRGDWIVPELWLQPVSQAYNERSGRIVIALCRGNTDLSNTINNRLLEAGVTINQTSQFGRKTQDSQWTRDYHTFKLFWTQDQLVFSVDDQEVARLPDGSGVIDPALNNGILAPFDREFYITLGVHVAGTKDFPESMQNKPWKNSDPKRFLRFWESKDSWIKTWDEDSALRVQSVKVTAL